MLVNRYNINLDNGKGLPIEASSCLELRSGYSICEPFASPPHPISHAEGPRDKLSILSLTTTFLPGILITINLFI